MWFFQLIFWLFAGYWIAKLLTEFIQWLQEHVVFTVSDGVYLFHFILIIVFAVIGSILF